MSRAAEGAIESVGFTDPVGYQPSEKYCLTRTAAPAAPGDDILVPDIPQYPESVPP